MTLDGLEQPKRNLAEKNRFKKNLKEERPI